METFTFYSYKGGTGRSLLVANAARYLASLGKRVVAIDFDLEAPGLHYKMHIGRPGERAGDVVPERGFVDYLLAVAGGEAEVTPLFNYFAPVPLPPATLGTLHLMPAGAAPSGTYWKALAALTRRDFFSDPDGAGIAACLELKARIEDELRADYILIDSRTGITEMAGLATTLLADKVVCLMIDNQESLTGARAVMRSFARAPRLKAQGQIELLPVLSRVPEDSGDTKQRVLRFLNEHGPSEDETLSLERLFLLRIDPDLAATEKLHLGSKGAASRSRLHQDYLALLEAMVTADSEMVEIAARRYEAIARMKSWLTERSERSHYRRLPEAFDEDQIDEGVELGSREKRYADLVAYGGKDRTEALLAVEYVEDLGESDAWVWWENNTNLRCVILIGTDKSLYLPKRVFTRSRRERKFRERDETNGWFVKWPVSFSALDDPGDRSVDSMLRAVQRGEDSFIGLLVIEWEHSSFATMHGGAPYRPHLARRILDGLAQVSDQEMEMRVLWRTAPDPFERDFKRHRLEGGSLEEMTTRELHAPLWWRLSVQSKIEYSGHRGHRRHEAAPSAGIDLLAHDLMGLTLDQDREFRYEVQQIVGEEAAADDEETPVYRFADLFQERELKFSLSDDPSPELVRRAALDYLLRQPGARSADSVWNRAEDTARNALEDTRLLARLIPGSNRQLQLPTCNLLGAYDPETCHVTIYRKLMRWSAGHLNVDERALGNVVFLHEMVYAICHLGRDLDGRMWADFGLPPAKDINFRPSLMLETFARYFSLRLIERLEDATLMAAFDRLNACAPAEYQVWQRLRHAPVEQVRKILLQARAGLDGVLWADYAQ